MNSTSYTSASTVPYKLFRNKGVMEALEAGCVPLTHLQYIPTNRCNLSCTFCSCKNRDKQQEMNMSDVQKMVRKVKELGCQSVTITGGGEPLLHFNINDIIELFTDAGIQVGLVTNGILLGKLEADVTWCRISCADERPLDGFRPQVEKAVEKFPEVDWAFSYVLQPHPDVENLRAHFAFAEAHKFTHVRVVADLLCPDSIPMDEIRSQADSPLAIWQPRSLFDHGADVCYLSELKPEIGPDGQVYPCCGVQYAQEKPSLDLSMGMGHFSELPFLPFDGSQCVRCYYGDYNRALDASLGEVAHAAFI